MPFHFPKQNTILILSGSFHVIYLSNSWSRTMGWFHFLWNLSLRELKEGCYRNDHCWSAWDILTFTMRLDWSFLKARPVLTFHPSVNHNHPHPLLLSITITPINCKLVARSQDYDSSHSVIEHGNRLYSYLMHADQNAQDWGWLLEGYGGEPGMAQEIESSKPRKCRCNKYNCGLNMSCFSQ